MGEFKSVGPNISSYPNPEVMHFNFLLELLIRTVSYQILDMKKLKLMHQLSNRILIVFQSAIYLEYNQTHLKDPSKMHLLSNFDQVFLSNLD